MEVFDGFRQQDLRVCAGPRQPQHALAGDGVVLVPVHRELLLQGHNLLIQLEDSKCVVPLLVNFLISKSENREELIIQGGKKNPNSLQ